jgi:hypothetical protein
VERRAERRFRPAVPGAWAVEQAEADKHPSPPGLGELTAFEKIATVLGTEAAAANLAGIAPDEDRDVVLEVVTTVFGRPVTPLALGRQI